MSVVALSEQHWSVEHRSGVPHDPRRHAEILDGGLSPNAASSWIHQRCIAELLKLLEPFIEDSGIGIVLSAPAEIVLDGGVSQNMWFEGYTPVSSP